jgi:hypothetical protein
MPVEAAAQRATVPRDRLGPIVSEAAIQPGVVVIRRDGIDTVMLTQAGLPLQRGEFAVLRTSDAALQVAGPLPAPTVDTAGSGPAPFVALPFRFVTPDSALTGEWVLRAIYKIGSGLRWQPAEERFTGELFLAVEDTSRRRESRPLPVPVRFQLISDADLIDPEAVALEHTNFPLTRIRVGATSALDSVRVHLVPEFDVSGIDIWMPVEPTLALDVSPRTIQGWGIQSARIVARVVGTSSARPMVLSVTSSAGALDSTRLTIDATGIAETRLRSEGIGSAQVRLAGAGAGVSADVRFIFPWIFLLAALLGGVFGGLAAAAQSKQGRKKTRWGEYTLKGVFAGILAALAWYALGINLLHLDLGVARFNELAVFTLAALAGYFGIPRTQKAPAAR